MPYIGGASPDSQVGTSAAYRSQSYTSTAGQTTFTVDGGYTPGYIDVYVNGIKQVNGVDVTATNGTTIVFASALSAGYTVEVQALRNIAVNATTLPVSSIAFSDGTVLNSAWGSVSYLQYTGNGTQTAYSTTPYTASSVNYTSVYISGVYQRKNTYSWAGTTLTFTSAPPNGAAIEIVINYQTSQVGLPSAGTISPSMLTTGGPSWTSGGNVTISSALTAGSATLSGTLAAGNTTITGSLSTSSKGITATSLPTGSIIQVAQSQTSSSFSTASATYQDIVSVTITPTSSSNKILLIASFNGCNDANQAAQYRFYNNTTAAVVGYGYAILQYTQVYSNIFGTYIYLDSPATTSAQTYKLQYQSQYGGTVYVNRRAFNDSTQGITSLTLMEVVV